MENIADQVWVNAVINYVQRAPIRSALLPGATATSLMYSSIALSRLYIVPPQPFSSLPFHPAFTCTRHEGSSPYSSSALYRSITTEGRCPKKHREKRLPMSGPKKAPPSPLTKSCSTLSYDLCGAFQWIQNFRWISSMVGST